MIHLNIESFILFIIICLCVKICVTDNTVRKVNGKRIFANVLFRHGERTPLNMYPTDPWANESYWPIGYGQLTNAGKREAFELGQYLHERYIDLVGNGYKWDLIYVRSSNTDRTIMTAQTVLAGLFPPLPDQQWSTKIVNWQPIPIRTIPKHLDHILAFKRDCPKYRRLLREYIESNEQKLLMKRYRYLFNYLSQMTERSIDTYTSVRNVFSILAIEERHNRSLPVWSKSVYPGGDMEQCVTLSETSRSGTRQLARLRGGFLLTDIIQHMREKFEQKEISSMWLYSGHDTTLTTLLNTMNMFEHHIVPFAACLMIELWIYDKMPFVEIYYRNSTVQSAILLNIPNCGKSCPLNRFIQLYDDVLTGDFNDECRDDYDNAKLILHIGFISFCIIFIGSILYIFIRRMFQRRIVRISSYWYRRVDL